MRRPITISTIVRGGRHTTCRTLPPRPWTIPWHVLFASVCTYVGRALDIVPLDTTLLLRWSQPARCQLYLQPSCASYPPPSLPHLDPPPVYLVLNDSTASTTTPLRDMVGSGGHEHCRQNYTSLRAWTARCQRRYLAARVDGLANTAAWQTGGNASGRWHGARAGLRSDSLRHHSLPATPANLVVMLRLTPLPPYRSASPLTLAPPTATCRGLRSQHAYQR